MTTTLADVRLSLPARPENVAVVRHVLGAFGEPLELGRHRLEDVRLAVTEACTNVVRHAYDRSDGPMDVDVRPLDDRLEVVVSDSGRGMAPSADRTGPGFGIPMMATLCDELEIDRGAARGSRVTMCFHRGAA